MLTNLMPVLATSSLRAALLESLIFISVKLCLINRVSSLTLLLYSSLGNLGPTNCPLFR